MQCSFGVTITRKHWNDDLTVGYIVYGQNIFYKNERAKRSFASSGSFHLLLLRRSLFDLLPYVAVANPASLILHIQFEPVGSEFPLGA